MRPVAWTIAACGPAVTRLMRSMAYGIHCAGIVRMKKDACWPRSSWVDVYAMASTRAELKVIPPVTSAFKPYSNLLDDLKPVKTPFIAQNEFKVLFEM